MTHPLYIDIKPGTLTQRALEWIYQEPEKWFTLEVMAKHLGDRPNLCNTVQRLRRAGIIEQQGTVKGTRHVVFSLTRKPYTVKVRANPSSKTAPVRYQMGRKLS
jgi:hypothetical protein